MNNKKKKSKYCLWPLENKSKFFFRGQIKHFDLCCIYNRDELVRATVALFNTLVRATVALFSTLVRATVALFSTLVRATLGK